MDINIKNKIDKILGGKVINQGYKGQVIEVYNDNSRDKETLYYHLFEDNPKEIILITIDEGKNIKVTKKETIHKILELLKNTKNTLVKKFINTIFIFGLKKHNFNNELLGYKKLINIFKKDISKHTTIKSGFLYNNRKIYGIIFNNNYYIFLEKCYETLDYIKFTQNELNKCTKQIMETLDILNSNDYIHNDIKPNNIILCKNRYKIIDWEASGEIKKQPKTIFNTRNGNFAYNHPFKLYNLGVSLFIYNLIYKVELKVYKYKNKNLLKLKTPKLIQKKINDSFNKVIDYNNNIKKTNKDYYMKLYDYYSFALTIIYLAEINNLKYNKILINPILEKFFIYL